MPFHSNFSFGKTVAECTISGELEREPVQSKTTRKTAHDVQVCFHFLYMSIEPNLN
jgi:hypothetical protein